MQPMTYHTHLMQLDSFEYMAQHNCDLINYLTQLSGTRVLLGCGNGKSGDQGMDFCTLIVRWCN